MKRSLESYKYQKVKIFNSVAQRLHKNQLQGRNSQAEQVLNRDIQEPLEIELHQLRVKDPS